MQSRILTVILCLLALLPGPLSSCTEETPAQKDFQQLRPPLLGLSIEKVKDRDVYRLISHEKPKKVLAVGSFKLCEEHLMKTLERRYGTGQLNIPFPTFGGKQFWSDQVVYCGWRIQKNVYTDHCRLLDPDDVRYAWGTFEACRVALEKRRIEKGLRPRSEHAVFLVHGLMRLFFVRNKD